MPIHVTTVYTKETLLRYNRYLALSKKFFWYLMTLCTLVVIACFLLVELWGDGSSTVTSCMIFILAMDLLYVFLYFILPHITVKKAKNLNTVLNYDFHEDVLRIEAVNSYATETSTVQYSILNKAHRNGNDLYLFISRQQAYLVDLSELSYTQTNDLKQLLLTKIKPKKFRWD